MKTNPFVLALALNIFGVALYADQNIVTCKDILQNDFAQSSSAYYKTSLKRHDPNLRYDHEQLKTLFGIRDRMREKNQDYDSIMSESEAALFSELKGMPLHVGDQITSQQFETLMLKAFSGLMEWQIAHSSQTSKKLDPDEVYQAAMIGLLKSIRDYDPNKAKISGVIQWNVTHEIVDLIINHESSIKIYSGDPGIFRLHKTILRIANEIFQKNFGTTPSYKQIAKEFNKQNPDYQYSLTTSKKGLDAKDVKDILEKQATTSSLSAVIGEEEVHALSGAEQAPQLTLKLVQQLMDLFKKANLDDRQIRVLVWRYDLPIKVKGDLPRGEEGLTLNEIGTIEKISTERVRQIESSAMSKLQKTITLYPQKFGDLKDYLKDLN